VHWVARVGLDYVKKRVLDDAEDRKTLYARLVFALQGEADPWEERVKEARSGGGELAREFEVLSV